MATLKKIIGPDGKATGYEVRYDSIEPTTSRRIQHRKRFKRLEPARIFLTKVGTDINDGSYIEPAKVPLSKWLDDWLAIHKMKIETSTYDSYKRNAAKIKAALGGINIQTLRPSQIESFYKQLRDDGLSSSTVQRVHAVMHKALAAARRDALIKSNPADMIDRPAASTKPATALTPEAVTAIITQVQNTDAYMPALIACTTGLRRGELLGLRWGDIDLKKGTLYVQRVVSETSEGRALKEPKTDQSVRLISIPDLLINELTKHKREQQKNRLQFGKDYVVSEDVCTRADGSPIPLTMLSRTFSRAAERAGYPGVRLHDFRHANITFMLMAGVPVQVAAARAGHSKTSTTVNLYSHVLKGMDADAASKINDVLTTLGT